MASSCSTPLPGIHGVTLVATNKKVAVGAKVDGVVLACANDLNFADSLRLFGSLLASAYGALDPRERPTHGYVPGCADLDYTVTDLTVDGSSFTVEPHPTVEHGLRFSAIAPGVSTVSVTVRSATETKTVSATLTAAEVSHVSVFESCDELPSYTARRANAYPHHTRQTVSTNLFGPDGYAVVGYDYRGEVFEGLAPVPLEPVDRFITSPTAAVAQVVVLGEPASSFREVLYSSTEVFDGLQLWGTAPANFMVGDSLTVRALPTIDGGVPCGYVAVESSVESLTPEVCLTGVDEPDGGLRASSAVSPAQAVRVVARGAGECHLKARRANTEGDLSLHVQRGWVAQATVPAGVTVRAGWGTSPSNLYLAADERLADAGLSYPWPDAGVSPCTVGAAPCGEILAEVYHFDGAALAKVDLPATAGLITALWGSGPADVFAVGWFGTILHFDGRAWSRMTSGTEVQLFAIAGSGPTDVWAGGADGVLLHYDGARWSPRPPVANAEVSGLWFESPTNGYAATPHALLHWDGGSWSVERTDDSGWFNQLSGSGRGDVWSFGSQATHFDGATWSTTPPPFEAQCSAHGRAVSPTEVFSFAGSDLCHFDGNAWSRLSSPGSLVGLWAAGSDVFAATSTQLWRLIRD